MAKRKQKRPEGSSNKELLASVTGLTDAVNALWEKVDELSEIVEGVDPIDPPEPDDGGE